MTFPPPLRLIYYVILGISKLFFEEKEASAVSKEETDKYHELLLHLVKTKKLIEEDAHIADDFLDLKKDFSNMLEEKVEDLKRSLEK